MESQILTDDSSEGAQVKEKLAFALLPVISGFYLSYCIKANGLPEQAYSLFLALFIWFVLFLLFEVRGVLVLVSFLPLGLLYFVHNSVATYVAVISCGIIVAIQRKSFGQLRRHLVLAGWVCAYLMIDQSGLFWQATEFVNRGLKNFPLLAPSLVSPNGVRSLGVEWTFISLLAICGGNRGSVEVRSRIYAKLGLVALSMICSLTTNSDIPSMVLAASLWLSSPLESLNSQRSWDAQRSVTALALGCICLGFVLSANQIVDGKPKTRKVVIVDGGLKTLTVPSGPPLMASEPPQASFGAMVRLLKENGWEPKICPASKLSASIEDAALCIQINPQTYLTRVDKSSLLRFVSSGGGFLVLGDHTDIAGIRGPLNDALSFTDISFRFDSAIALPHNFEWEDGLKIASINDFFGYSNVDFGIAIGASLRVGPDARVLIRGERGFSDPGNYATGPSHLGSMQPAANKNVGSLCLVAEQKIGDGLVQVWGDTSGFQDSALTETSAFVLCDLERLASHRYLFTHKVACIICASATAIWLICLMASPLLVQGVLLVIVAVGMAVDELIKTESVQASRRVTRTSPIQFDCSHGSEIPKADNSGQLYTSKLRNLILRTGQLSVNEYDTIPCWNATKCVFILAPTRPYSEQEARSLRRWVENGGTLFLSIGRNNTFACKSLFRMFDFEVGDSQRGRGIGAVTDRPWVYDAANHLRSTAPLIKVPAEVPITFIDSYAIQSKQGETVCSALGDPLMKILPWRKGRIVIVGDSRFYTDKNLGERDTWNLPNAHLIYRLLSQDLPKN